MLKMKTNTVGQVKELTTPFQADILEPNTKADIVFSASADMIAVCQNYGQVFAACSLDPSQCHVTGKDAEIASVGEKWTAIMQAINFVGKPIERPITSLEYGFTSEITGAQANHSVERRQSQYEISCQGCRKMFRYGGGGGTSNTWLPWQRCLPYEAHNFISITNCAEAEITQSKYEICAGVVTEIAI